MRRATTLIAGAHGRPQRHRQRAFVRHMRSCQLRIERALAQQPVFASHARRNPNRRRFYYEHPHTFSSIPSATAPEGMLALRSSPRRLRPPLRAAQHAIARPAKSVIRTRKPTTRAQPRWTQERIDALPKTSGFLTRIETLTGSHTTAPCSSAAAMAPPSPAARPSPYQARDGPRTPLGRAHARAADTRHASAR